MLNFEVIEEIPGQTLTINDQEIKENKGKLKNIGKCTLLRVPASTGIDLSVGYMRSKRASLSRVLRGHSIIRSGPDILYVYEHFDCSVEDYLEMKDWNKEAFIDVLREIFSALHQLHAELRESHGNLNLNNIVIIKSDEDKVNVKLKMLGENKPDDIQKECQDLSPELFGLVDRIDLIEWVNPIIEHLRVTGSRNLHKSLFLLDDHKRLDYLRLAYTEVSCLKVDAKFEELMGQRIKLNWIQIVKNERRFSILNKLITKVFDGRDFLNDVYTRDNPSPTNSSTAFGFLKYCRNYAIHFGDHDQPAKLSDKIKEKDQFDVLVAVSRTLFHRLHEVLCKIGIFIGEERS